MTEAAASRAHRVAPAHSLGALVLEAGPTLVAVAVFVWWAAAEGGFALTRSFPGTVLVLGALVTVVIARPRELVEASRALKAALALGSAFALVTLLSPLWADVPGDAWAGGNRTALYAAAFALFALSPLRTSALALCLSAWSLGVACVGVATLAHAATDGDLSRIFVNYRLSQPIGYVNATCALFLMAFWPAAVLASRRQLPVPARALLVAAAYVLVALAVLTQSRASLVAVPITAVIAFALVPGRMRLALTLLPIAALLALTLDPLLGLFEALDAGDGREGARDALRALGVGAGSAAVAGALFALLDRRVAVPPRVARRADITLAAAAAALALAAGAVVAVAVDDPVAKADEAWEEFNSGYPETFEGSHFSGGLGDFRGDYWRVALLEFRDHPLVGAGADNFGPAYLREGRFGNEARFPHSTPLAVLSSTGVLGATLFAGFLACAVAAYLRVRRRDPLTGAVGAAALLVLAHWLVHGSVDWFWEIPALGAPAMGFLGAAAAAGAPATATQRGGRRGAIAVCVAALVVVAAAAPPWLAARQTHRATAGWRNDPDASIAALERAARLDPLSERPYVLGGAIANRTGRHARARQLFLQALERNHVNWYALLELAVAQAELGDRAAALRSLAQVREFNPFEPATAEVRERVVAREPVDLEQIDALFRERVRSRTR